MAKRQKKEKHPAPRTIDAEAEREALIQLINEQDSIFEEATTYVDTRARILSLTPRSGNTVSDLWVNINGVMTKLIIPAPPLGERVFATAMLAVANNPDVSVKYIRTPVARAGEIHYLTVFPRP